MHRVELKHISIRSRDPFIGWQRVLHRVFLGLFVAAISLELAQSLWPTHSFATPHQLDCFTLGLAVAATALSLSRQLPAQNVVLVAFVVGMAGGAAQLLSALAAVPFGPIVYNAQNTGRFLVYPLPWSVPLIWIVVLLNGRGVARLMLRSRRRGAYYGFWVIGLAAVLVVIFELSLEPYATQVKEYWSWKPTKIHSDWFGTPWVDLVGCAAVAALILLFVTPALINKSPNPSPSPSFHPLIMWELMSLLFLAGERTPNLQAAFVFTLCQMVLVGVGAILGAKIRRGARSEIPKATRPAQGQAR